MKTCSTLSIIASAAMVIGGVSGFTVLPQQAIVTSTSTNTQLSMGFFDMFSDEARQAREEKKKREAEEQMRLQQEMLARRTNPEMMEQYERKVAMRRQLRMAGYDEEASNIDVFDEDQTLPGDEKVETVAAVTEEEEATVA